MPVTEPGAPSPGPRRSSRPPGRRSPARAGCVARRTRSCRRSLTAGFAAPAEGAISPRLAIKAPVAATASPNARVSSRSSSLPRLVGRRSPPSDPAPGASSTVAPTRPVATTLHGTRSAHAEGGTGSSSESNAVARPPTTRPLRRCRRGQGDAHGLEQVDRRAAQARGTVRAVPPAPRRTRPPRARSTTRDRSSRSRTRPWPDRPRRT